MTGTTIGESGGDIMMAAGCRKLANREPDFVIRDVSRRDAAMHRRL